MSYFSKSPHRLLKPFNRWVHLLKLQSRPPLRILDLLGFFGGWMLMMIWHQPKQCTIFLGEIPSKVPYSCIVLIPKYPQKNRYSNWMIPVWPAVRKSREWWGNESSYICLWGGWNFRRQFSFLFWASNSYFPPKKTQKEHKCFRKRCFFWE